MMPLCYWSSQWHAQWELMPALTDNVLHQVGIGRCRALLACCFFIIITISSFVSTAVRRPLPKISSHFRCEFVKYILCPQIFLARPAIESLTFPYFVYRPLVAVPLNRLVHLFVICITWPAQPHFFILLAYRAIYLPEKQCMIIARQNNREKKLCLLEIVCRLHQYYCGTFARPDITQGIMAPQWLRW